jgi:glycosyltransferase involved in cell wall biosynthesis
MTISLLGKESVATQSVVFIATSWGSAYGGINSFNEDLVKTLARNVEREITVACVVINCNEGDRQLASANGVLLLSLDDTGTEFTLNSIHTINAKIKNGNLANVRWIVGHDVITGDIAVELRNDYYQEATLIIIHHMNFEAYDYLKQNKSPRKSHEKSRNQQKLLCKADLIVAVGPKLEQSVRDKVPSEDARVSMILPGLVESVEMRIRKPNSFSAIIIGRLDPDTDRVKQASLAVVAFARAIKNHKAVFGVDASLTIIGLPTDNDDAIKQSDELKRLAENEAGFAVNIRAYPYLEDRAALIHELATKSVAMMLSVHEGFGLSGWEAIAAGVPLITTENSGAYKAIEGALGGMGTGCLYHLHIQGSSGEQPYTETDIVAVEDALISIRVREDSARRDARNLSRLLRQRCQWRNATLEFAKFTEIPIRKQFLEMEIASSGLDDIESDIDLSFRYRDVMVLNARMAVYARLNEVLVRNDENHTLVIFGGIADALRNEEITQKYASWLLSSSNRRLFICYEEGAAASARATVLSVERLDPTTGSINPVERMAKKEIAVLEFKDRLHGLLAGQSDRAIFLGLRKYLTTYVVLINYSLYLTPLFDRRSSDSVSFWCVNPKTELSIQAIDYMAHHLKELGDDPNAGYLIKYISEIGINNEK